MKITHRLSPEDLEFRRAFEACEVSPADFDHAAHVRLAYIYLCEHPIDAAVESMKTSSGTVDCVGACRAGPAVLM